MSVKGVIKIVVCGVLAFWVYRVYTVYSVMFMMGYSTRPLSEIPFLTRSAIQMQWSIISMHHAIGLKLGAPDLDKYYPGFYQPGTRFIGGLFLSLLLGAGAAVLQYIYPDNEQHGPYSTNTMRWMGIHAKNILFLLFLFSLGHPVLFVWVFWLAGPLSYTYFAFAAGLGLTMGICFYKLYLKER